MLRDRGEWKRRRERDGYALMVVIRLLPLSLPCPPLNICIRVNRDPWIAPHTCGELCGKALPGACGHTCLLLCHPGPCPPCPLVVDAPCHCGRVERKKRWEVV